MRRAQQEELLPAGAPTRVWCRRCHRLLTDAESRRRRLGPECDPDRDPPAREHHVDQDAIPGL